MKDKRYLAALRERNRLTSDLERLFVLRGLQGRKGKGKVEISCEMLVRVVAFG
jgi:hypothetical protein